MEDKRFDQLARILGGVGGRREALKALLGGSVAGALGAFGLGEAEAKRKGKSAREKKGKNNGKDRKGQDKAKGRASKGVRQESSCIAYGDDCTNPQQCCDKDTRGVVCQKPTGGDSNPDQKTCNCPGVKDGETPDFNTDPNNCGKCKTKCEGGTPVCSGGSCVATTCTADNCAQGCCNGTKCILWTNQTKSECGTGGKNCKACDGTDICSKSANACQPEATCNIGSCNENHPCTCPGVETCGADGKCCRTRIGIYCANNEEGSACCAPAYTCASPGVFPPPANGGCQCANGYIECGGKCILKSHCCTGGEPGCKSGQVCNETTGVCECPADKPHRCNGVGPCVACCDDSACSNGQVCTDGSCVCPAAKPHRCNGAGACVACCGDNDCANGQVCTDHVCVCPAAKPHRCNGAGPCVACCGTGQAECANGQRCENGTCVPDEQCVAVDKPCNGSHPCCHPDQYRCSITTPTGEGQCLKKCIEDGKDPGAGGKAACCSGCRCPDGKCCDASHCTCKPNGESAASKAACCSGCLCSDGKCCDASHCQTPAQCAKPGDCGKNTDCRTYTCDGGTCKTHDTPAGQSCSLPHDTNNARTGGRPPQRQGVCDGKGECVPRQNQCQSASDCGQAPTCRVNTCDNGRCGRINAPVNTPCTTGTQGVGGVPGGPGFCDANGECVTNQQQCTTPASCGTAPVCQSYSCTNGFCAATSLAANTPCAINGFSGLCNGAGVCVTGGGGGGGGGGGIFCDPRFCLAIQPGTGTCAFTCQAGQACQAGATAGTAGICVSTGGATCSATNCDPAQCLECASATLCRYKCSGNTTCSGGQCVAFPSGGTGSCRAGTSNLQCCKQAVRRGCRKGGGGQEGHGQGGGNCRRKGNRRCQQNFSGS